MLGPTDSEILCDQYDSIRHAYGPDSPATHGAREMLARYYVTRGIYRDMLTATTALEARDVRMAERRVRR